MTVLLSVICLIEVLFFYRIEAQRIVKISPIICIGLPYCVFLIFVAVNDLFTSNTYDKISIFVPVLSFACFFFFELMGQIVMYIKLRGSVHSKLKDYYTEKTSIIECKHSKVIMVVLVVNTVLILSNLVLNNQLAILNLANLKGDFSTGIIAHLINLESVLLIVNYSSAQKNKISLFFKAFCILWAIFLSTANAKYSMLFFVVSIIFSHILSGKKQVSFTKLFIALGIASGGFLITYIIRFLSLGYSLKTIPYDFIYRHFFYYMTGSFYSFSRVLEGLVQPTNGIGMGIFFAPIINVVNIIIGKPFVTTISNFCYINVGQAYTSTNVFTLFGSVFLESGWAGLLIVLSILAIVAYNLYYRYIISYKVADVSFYSYICATLVFSFFNCFYGTLNVWETVILMYLIRVSDSIAFRLR